MADLITSCFISDMNGKLGMDVIYRRNGHLVVRKNTKPTKPRTPSQIGCGLAWQALRLSWQALTEEQRLSWLFAAIQIYWINNIGNKFRPNGFQLYLKCNTNLKYCGLSNIQSFVSPVPIIQLTDIKFENNFNINFTGLITDTNLYYLIYATKPLSQGIGNGKKYLRFIGYIPPNTANLFNIQTMYIALFPTPTTGQKVFVMLKPVEKLSGFNGIDLSIVSTIF